MKGIKKIEMVKNNKLVARFIILLFIWIGLSLISYVLMPFLNFIP